VSVKSVDTRWVVKMRRKAPASRVTQPRLALAVLITVERMNMLFLKGDSMRSSAFLLRP
jgi:hypothetical protein